MSLLVDELELVGGCEVESLLLGAELVSLELGDGSVGLESWDDPEDIWLVSSVVEETMSPSPPEVLDSCDSSSPFSPWDSHPKRSSDPSRTLK